ncbi:hypothetical protein ACFX14_042169 [Malus domestica]
MGGKNSSRRRDHERDDGGSRDWERRIRRRSSSYDVDKERYHQSEYSKKIPKGNEKCLKIEELGLGGKIQMVMRGRKIMRYREDRGGEKERTEENNRS